MKIDEILKNESGVHIHLHKEGLFWRAYEYSAFLFVKHVAAFQVKKVFVKTVNKEIVSVGFPSTSFDKHKQRLNILEQNDKCLIAEPLDKACEQSFEEWKTAVNLKETNFIQSSRDVVAPNDTEQQALDELKSFDISSATPVEALVFLQQLQQRLKKTIVDHVIINTL